MQELINNPFIHFHIPKTAGTSLRATFVEEYGPEAVAYKLYTGDLVRISDMPFTNIRGLDRTRRVARSLGLLNVYSDVIGFINRNKELNLLNISEIADGSIAVATGHFTANDIIDEVADIPRTTVLRDPFSRMQSHYAHWREAKGKMWWHNGSIPYSDNVSFETFATDPALANYQTRAMGGLGFLALGSTDYLPDFFEEIGIAQRTAPRLNPRRGTAPNRSLDEGFVRDFSEMHKADYELFTTVTEKYS